MYTKTKLGLLPKEISDERTVTPIENERNVFWHKEKVRIGFFMINERSMTGFVFGFSGKSAQRSEVSSASRSPSAYCSPRR